MPKQNATATIEGTRKRGRPRKRWTEEIEDGLNVIGVKYRRPMARDSWELWKIVLEGKVQNVL
jgi:hypothetical protein